MSGVTPKRSLDSILADAIKDVELGGRIPGRDRAMDEDLEDRILRILDPHGFALMEGGYIDEPDLPKAPFFSDYPVHPIFRQDIWTVYAGQNVDAISDADYNLILPVLKLASRMLEHPKIVPFFSGMLARPLEESKTPTSLQKFGRRLFRYHLGPSDTEAEFHNRAKTTWQKIANLQSCLTFRFGYQGQDCWGTAYPTDEKGLRPNTFGCEIALSKRFLKVLRGEYTPRDCRWAKVMRVCEESAMLRTMYFMVRDQDLTQHQDQT